MGGILIGKNIVIMGDWDESPEPEGRLVIRMPVPPVRGYGAGWNKTTQLCIEELERLVTGNTTVLDLGTGTGILAVAAAKLGAKKVCATENDPGMNKFARQVIHINGVKVVVSEGHEKLPEVDICVANIGDAFWDIHTTVKAKKAFIVGNQSGEVEYAPRS